MRARLITAGWLFAAWLPFLLFWMFFAMTYGRESPLDAAARAVATIGVAALLGIGVWHLCARLPLPPRVRAGFYIRQFGAGILYAATWTFSTYVFDAIWHHRSLWRMIAGSPVLWSQLVMGLWLYGVVAGASYAIRTQRRALRAEAEMNAARLEALRNRLHPHFLFNALHTVGALARQDATRAENAIEKLGQLLRYSLHDDRGDIVPLADEWEFTRQYLDFEQLRYESRLRVDADIDPECLTCGVPSFALQTLVENAVRHSIDKRPEGGRIEISARREAEMLRIRTRDDGNGHAESSAGLRKGLRTLRERLDAVYGSATQLTSDAANGYEVSLIIPFRPVDE